jgi:hypothetical protein
MVVSVQARDFTNLSVVLGTQPEHGKRLSAEHLLLYLPKRRQQAQEENCVSYHC